MKCDICGIKRAIVHIQQIAGNEEINISVCQKCAKDKGLTIENADIGTSLKNMLNNFEDIKKALNKQDHDRICHGCGTKLEDIRKNLKTGCSSCYLVFKKQINSYYVKTTGAARHRGKYPFRINILTMNKHRIDALKKKLGKAVTDEDFEEAAYLRDRIKLIQNYIKKNDL